MTQKIIPFLWFEKDAEEALTLYTSVFPDARIADVTRFGAGGPFPAGTLQSATFELAGQRFMAINGGPHDPFNDAISLFIACESQEEIDRYWDALLAGGGTPTQCGWLKDRFGVSWQVTPVQLLRYLADPDAEKAGRTAAAMMSMVKLDLAALTAAYEGTA